MKAFLLLEDGTVFEGTHIGADKEVISEIVFNTSMAGYLDVLTDPSYAGQAVCMTYPLIGNYGVCEDDVESDRTWPDAMIVRELSRMPSNFRCDLTIQQFLEKHGVTGIAGIDTRALTKILRTKGTMNGMITTNEAFQLDEIIPRLKAYKIGRVVDKVICKDQYKVNGASELAENGPIFGHAKFVREDYAAGRREKKPSFVTALNGKGLKAALLDLGTEKNIIESLTMRGCEVTVYPGLTAAEEILADKPDGIMLSGGPGNPKECMDIVENVKILLDAKIPMFATGLGHQLVALAAGADTFQLKYGHRGSNQPVRELANGKVYIASQNHGYAVDMDKLDEKIAEPSFINVNDGTCEGLSYLGRPVFTVQFHPECCGDAQNNGNLYERFIEMMKEGK